MARCPFCDAELTENEALGGRCPACRFELPAEWLASFPFALKEADAVAVASQPLDRPDPLDPGHLTDTSDRADTSDQPGVPGPSDTLVAPEPPGVPPLPQDLAQRVVTLWNGHVEPGACITTSL